MKFCVLIFDTSYSKYMEYKNGEFVLRNCGWGGFLEFAAKHYEALVTSITISKKQYEFTKNKI